LNKSSSSIITSMKKMIKKVLHNILNVIYRDSRANLFCGDSQNNWVPVARRYLRQVFKS
jgi:hypothetical protein